jgi:hypothetical protein
MERVYLKFLDLYKAFFDLQKAQCLYANSGLEQIADPVQTEELRRMGLYDPDHAFPPSSSEQVSLVQRKMYGTVCQMQALYGVLEKHAPHLAEGIRQTAENLQGIKIELESLLFSNPVRIRNSDFQDSIDRLFGAR